MTNSHLQIYPKKSHKCNNNNNNNNNQTPAHNNNQTLAYNNNHTNNTNYTTILLQCPTPMGTTIGCSPPPHLHVYSFRFLGWVLSICIVSLFVISFVFSCSNGFIWFVSIYLFHPYHFVRIVGGDV